MRILTRLIRFGVVDQISPVDVSHRALPSIGVDERNDALAGPAAFMYAHAGILIEFTEPVGGASPRFTLFQQRAAVVLARKS
jgi:hypothetical protein